MSLTIWTSFFANRIDNKPITQDPRTVAIARWAPFKGMRRYETLMPSKELLDYFKRNKVPIEDGEKLYRKMVLKNLDPKKVLKELEALAIEKQVILCCWCHDNRICHRNEVAKWLRKAGAKVKELPDRRPDREKEKDPMYVHEFLTEFIRWS